MWRTNLLLALRLLWRNKTVSAINVAGLAAALAVCVLALLFIRRETGFDAWHRHAGHIWAVYGVPTDPMAGEGASMGLTPQVDEALRTEVPGVARTVRMQLGSSQVTAAGRTFDDYMLAVDPSFFQVFTFPLVDGEAASALDDPSAVVLTQETARKYFGQGQALGQHITLRVSHKDWSQKPPKEITVEEERVVTGVLAPPPGGSILRFRMLLPYSAADVLGFEGRGGTFVELTADADIADVRAGVARLGEEHFPGRRRLDLLPLRGAHFGRRIYGPAGIGSGTLEHSLLLGGLAALILAIACINFVNLSLGRALGRVLEVGVRKAVGARAVQLRQQWLVESTLIAAVAVAGGLVLARAMLPAFNEVVHQSLDLDLWSWQTLGAAACLSILVGILSGLYPALASARLHPVQALTGKTGSSGRARVGRALIVAQFVLSSVLVLAALTLERQLHFMQTKDLGFDGDQVYVATLEGGIDEATFERLVVDVGSRGQLVTALAAASPAPGLGSMGDWPFATGADTVRARTFDISPGLVRTLGLRLAAGRNLDPELAADVTHGVLLNRSAARLFGPGPVVGQTLTTAGPSGLEVTVVGVVEDFHFEALRQRIGPAVLRLKPAGTQAWNHYWHVLFRLDRRDLPGGVEEVRQIWDRALPEREMLYPRFLSEAFADRYEVEEHVATVLRWLTTVAVAIACMGLLGLALLAAGRRTKEVGIRKALGATVGSVVALMSRELAVLVLLGNVIAWPLAWYGLQLWLRMYAYRVDPGIGWFALAGAAMTLVALLTVSGQTLRSARVNPVDALRYE